MKIFITKIIKPGKPNIDCEECGSSTHTSGIYYLAYMNGPAQVRERIYCLRHGTQIADRFYNDNYIIVSISFFVRIQRKTRKDFKLQKIKIIEEKKE